MKHVLAVTSANGEVYLYLRKKGLPRVRLTSPLPPAGQEAGSDLEREVLGMVAALSPQKVNAGTLKEATRAYELSEAFRKLGAETQATYRGYLKEFDEAMGFLPIAACTPAFLAQLMERWSARGYRGANLRRQCLRNVLKPCLIAGTLPADPFILVGESSRPRTLAEPHVLWPMDLVTTAIELAIEQERFGLARAIAVARYTGARRGDVVSFTTRVRRNGRFDFLSGKKRVPVNIPEDPELTTWLARIPGRASEKPRRGRKVKAGAAPKAANVAPLHEPLVFNLQGELYTEDGLGQELAKFIAQARLSNLVAGVSYDLHGLRHTRGVELALAGCTDAQGAAQLGHSSPNSFAQYRRQADRILLADDAAEKIAQLRERTAAKAKNEVQKK